MTAVESPASRWRVDVLFDGRWVPRSSPRSSKVEAGEVLARLQGKQPGELFRVQSVATEPVR